MAALGYKPCLEDRDLWLKSQNQYGIDYYSYILCFVDDIMVVQHDARPILDRMDKFMKLKEISVGDPEIYLGAKLKKVQMDNDIWCQSISPSNYVQEAVPNCKNYLKENFSDEYELIVNAPNLFTLGYEPCMDVSLLLSPDKASYFQTIIGVMR